MLRRDVAHVDGARRARRVARPRRQSGSPREAAAAAWAACRRRVSRSAASMVRCRSASISASARAAASASASSARSRASRSGVAVAGGALGRAGDDVAGALRVAAQTRAREGPQHVERSRWRVRRGHLDASRGADVWRRGGSWSAGSPSSARSATACGSMIGCLGTPTGGGGWTNREAVPSDRPPPAACALCVSAGGAGLVPSRRVVRPSAALPGWARRSAGGRLGALGLAGPRVGPPRPLRCRPVFGRRGSRRSARAWRAGEPPRQAVISVVGFSSRGRIPRERRRKGSAAQEPR